MGRMSVATIDSPEFIKITSISPLVSKCEIKVLYVGENRNRSFITEEVATKMAQTLPGCPIVGYYIDRKEDFGDHGDQMVIDGEGVKFNKLTKPYGFVAPDSKIWFQNFNDTDEFGNTVVRKYLMTEGYLWTGQFAECRRVVDQGNPQSMELCDDETLKGHWSTDNNRGVDFFIINDAVFSKLCILGEDVEPCFEGASVTSPQVSSKFSKDDEFVKSLFNMVQELKELTYSLKEKGGTLMETQEINAVQEAAENTSAPIAEEFQAQEQEQQPEEAATENFSENVDNANSEISSEIDTNVEEFKKNEDDENKEEKEEDKSENKEEEKEEDEDEKKKYSLLEEKYALLEQEYNELKTNFELVNAEKAELIKFKASVEDNKKDELIKSFYMLSDEDKKDVIDHKSEYSLDDIEAKLSIICVRKKVNFNVEDNNDEDTSAPITYSLNGLQTSEADLPAWLKRVEERKQEKEI